MRKRYVLMFTIVAVTAIAIGCGTALAAETGAAAPAKKAEAAAPAKAPEAKAAAKPAAPAGVPAVVSGKIECKKATNKKGKEVTVCSIVVSSAQGTDGKAIDALKGKTLRVVGKNAGEAKKLDGKDAQITGAVIENKRIRVESVK